MRKKAPRYPGDGLAEFAAATREVLGLAMRLDKDPHLVRAGAVIRVRVAQAMRREVAAIRAEMAPRPANTGSTTTTWPESPAQDPYVRR